MELKRTALYPIHKQLNAVIRPFAGYEMPIHYGSISVEHKAVREQAGLFDVSHMCKFVIEGEKALSLLQYICSNDVSSLCVGNAQYTCLPNERGGIVDDAVLYRLGKSRYLLIANAANRAKNWQWIKKHNNSHEAQLKDSSDSYSILALQGPKAAAILQPLMDLDLESVPFYSFARDTVARIKNVLVSNTGYTGSGGYELYVENEAAQSLWTALQQSEVCSPQPAGLAARDTLRLEMGYCLYGQDIDETTSSIEAGLGWITKFTKTFVGSEYLQRQKIQGAPKRLVGLVIEEKGGIPRSGCSILNERGLKIGEVTSGSLSLSTQKGIALGYVATIYSEPHTKLSIQIRDRDYAAEVVKLPPWQKK